MSAAMTLLGSGIGKTIGQKVFCTTGVCPGALVDSHIPDYRERAASRFVAQVIMSVFWPRSWLAAALDIPASRLETQLPRAAGLQLPSLSIDMAMCAEGKTCP
jgi:hypothetical protein